MRLNGALQTILLFILAPVALANSNPAVQAPPRLCIDEDCKATDTSSKRGRKWNPGHYASLNGLIRPDNSAEMLKTHLPHIQELVKEPTVKGIQIQVQWSALEGHKPGDYSAGFALIDQYLQAAAKANKQLMLQICDRQFGYDTFTTADLTNIPKLKRFFPEYLLTNSKYGISLMHNGLTTRVWQAATMDRLIALIEAYGARYNSHPNFEMLTAGETAVGSTNPADGYSHAALATQLKRLNVAGRQAWPNTAFRVSTNFMGNDSVFVNYIAHMAQNELVFGGPDVIPNHSIQSNNILKGQIGGIDYRTKQVIASEVQSPQLGGSKGTFTPKQLYDWAMNESRPQYFIWLRNTWSGGDPQKWSTGILPFIRSINGKVYSTSCPESYKLGCVK